MHVYVYVCTCVCTCMYVRMYVRIHVCCEERMILRELGKGLELRLVHSVRTYVCVYRCTYVRTCTCMYMHICTYKCVLRRSENIARAGQGFRTAPSS